MKASAILIRALLAMPLSLVEVVPEVLPDARSHLHDGRQHLRLDGLHYARVLALCDGMGTSRPADRGNRRATQGDAAVHGGHIQIAGVMRMAPMRITSWTSYLHFTS
ncbi:hypothetical protein [Bradyrhizobium sp. 5.13L]